VQRSLALVKRLAAVLAALLLCVGMPSVAGAQLGPQNVPTTLTQDPGNDDGNAVNLDKDTGLSSLQLVLMFGGAAAVVALIAWLIMRDARSKVPATARGRTSAAGGGGTPAAVAGAKKSAREREREKARKRNKAKAVRDQRKRNRPR
jgi:hypothetical protein